MCMYFYDNIANEREVGGCGPKTPGIERMRPILPIGMNWKAGVSFKRNSRTESRGMDG